MPLDEAERDDTAGEHSVEEPQEQKPFVEGHAAGASSEVAGGKRPRFVPEHRKSEQMELCTEVQMGAVWAESDGKQRNGVLLPEEGSGGPKLTVAQVSSVGWVVGEVYNAGEHLKAPDTTDLRIAVKGTVEETAAARIVVSAVVGRDTDTAVKTQCAAR